MRMAPAITLRNLPRTNGLEADILKRAGKLETYCKPIIACRVLVELSERRHVTGNRYHVRIDLTVPSAEILVSHEASQRVAIREAFDVAKRRLQSHAQRRRGETKNHFVRARA